MLNNTGKSPIKRIPFTSSYGFYSLNTTSLPDSIANTIMNRVFDIEHITPKAIATNNYFLSAEDYQLMVEVIENITQPNENLVKLFNEFK